jgi:hypothetical protein
MQVASGLAPVGRLPAQLRCSPSLSFCHFLPPLCMFHACGNAHTLACWRRYKYALCQIDLLHYAARLMSSNVLTLAVARV